MIEEIGCVSGQSSLFDEVPGCGIPVSPSRSMFIGERHLRNWFRSATGGLGALTAWREVFRTTPRGDEESYRSLFLDALARESFVAEGVEGFIDFAVDQDWLSDLALHTQVVHKKSALNWQHGKLLYSLLRQHLETTKGERAFAQVFETGTARGFSALCMAKALLDSNSQGVVVSVDSLPHDRPRYWNCIDDCDGRKSRRELLADWPSEVARVIFLNASSPRHLDRVGIERIDFAFLDAQHTFRSVMEEYLFVEARQDQGDVIVFDDVTPGVFDGVVAAVDAVRERGLYVVEKFGRAERGYAVARRLAG